MGVNGPQAQERAGIGLVASGRTVERGLMEFLVPHLSGIYGQRVEISTRLPAPQYAFDERRGQYGSTAILARLRRSFEGVYERVLGIVDVDLFTPSLNFVFGEADILHGVAVVSLFRLRPERYGQTSNAKLLQERTLKEAVHELGHTFGMMHCFHYRCVMHFSNRLSDTDRKSFHFCQRCRESLTIGT
jgi:archaemetzincin